MDVNVAKSSDIFPPWSHLKDFKIQEGKTNVAQEGEKYCYDLYNYTNYTMLLL